LRPRSCSRIPCTPRFRSQETESEWETPDNYVAPIATMFTVSEPAADCEDFGYFCRPSVGPSSIAIYESDGVPDLSGQLLSTALKDRKSTRLNSSHVKITS